MTVCRDDPCHRCGRPTRYFRVRLCWECLMDPLTTDAERRAATDLPEAKEQTR